MKLTINTEFAYGDMVNYKSEKTKSLRKGCVIALEAWQSENMRPDAFMIYYTIEPEEYIGFEHDEAEKVFESCLHKL